MFQDQLNGQPRSMSVGQLYRDVQAGRLVVVSGVAGQLTPESQPLVGTWDSWPAKHREALDVRLRVVQALRRRGLTRGMRSAIREALPDIAKSLGLSFIPGDSAAMEWMRRFERSDGNPSALLPQHAVRKSPRRISTAALAVVREMLRTHYCVRTRPTLAAATLQIQRRLQDLVAQRQLRPEEARISIATIRRLKDEIDPYARDCARFGAAYARNQWRYSLGGKTCVRAMQRYEVDHTIVDLVVLCDTTGLPLGRPTITVVVDVLSSYVAGFFISFWGTGLSATFCALKVAFAPKDEYTRHCTGLRNPWLGFGIPEQLGVDNGLEFHSRQFLYMAMSLSMDLEFCAVRQPWLKPVVERALGSYLQHLPLHGRVEKPRTNYLPTNPRESARITFSALCEGLLKAFVDVHPFETNDRKLARPYDLFAESLERLPPVNLPADLRELDITVAASRQLTVGNEGVVTEYLRFNSRELQGLRRSIASSFKTTVKFQPNDLEYVYVQDPVSRGWLVVPCCHPEYARGLSLVQHRAIRTHKRGQLDKRNADETLMQAKLELVDLWNSHTVNGKRLKGGRQLAALGRFTSSQSLTSRPDAPALRPERLLAEAELAGEEREVPEFSAFSMR